MPQQSSESFGSRMDVHEILDSSQLLSPNDSWKLAFQKCIICLVRIAIVVKMGYVKCDILS